MNNSWLKKIFADGGSIIIYVSVSNIDEIFGYTEL